MTVLLALAQALFLGQHATARQVHFKSSSNNLQRLRQQGKQKPDEKITIVVNFNKHIDVRLESVHMLHAAYSAAYHRVVFTGLRPQGLSDHINWTECDIDWTLFELCLVYAMLEYPEAIDGGYIYVGDDTVVDPCQLQQLDRSNFWSPELHLVDAAHKEGWGASLFVLPVLVLIS